jgi:PucR C-terminal helix-turn-helix domain/GGDEF-like domain
MRDLSTRMIEAVLGGEGLGGVAELAAAEAGGPVVIVLPASGLQAGSPDNGSLNGLAKYAEDRVAGKSVETPREVAAAEPVVASGEEVGLVMLVADEAAAPGTSPPVDHSGVLRHAALAALAELAVSEAREEAAAELRGGLLEELRAGPLDADDVRTRAERLGCELIRGAVVLVAELETSRPGYAAALVCSEHEGALAEAFGARLYAILPARGGDEAPEVTLQIANRLTKRLRAHGPAAVSSFYPDPAELHRAFREAELILDVISRDQRIGAALEDGIAGSGVYRLLFRALISDPDEVRRFYEDTVEPLVRYDTQYRTDLLGTLEEYLAQDCNMNATARSIFAHRHTVAYRLDRVRELTGLDPSLSEDRERLGLGAKAYRILSPTLPR